MELKYQIAGHPFAVVGDRLCSVVGGLAGFRPFLTEAVAFAFCFREGEAAPALQAEQYRFDTEGVLGIFGRTDRGYRLSLQPEEGEVLTMWCSEGEREVLLSGNFEARLIRFALWVGYGLMTLSELTLAVHSSCIVFREQAFLFLGESGTGKSTHTRLWREHIEGSFLLNDDSPILRVEVGMVWVYGSPWSGKTPCYKAERYALKACIRLSQAPYNQVKPLKVLQAYGAIHPSCPPEFAYDSTLYDAVSKVINELLTHVPFYHLACLPNAEAAYVCATAVTEGETWKRES